MATPLSNLTRKLAPNNVCLDEEAMRAFEQLKELLCSAPVLRCLSPSSSRPMLLNGGWELFWNYASRPVSPHRIELTDYV